MAQKLIIAVGREEAGAPLDKVVYIGSCATEAETAFEEAGANGEIHSGEIYRNPQYWRRRTFDGEGTSGPVNRTVVDEEAEAKAKEEAEASNSGSSDETEKSTPSTGSGQTAKSSAKKAAKK